MAAAHVTYIRGLHSVVVDFIIIVLFKGDVRIFITA